MALVMDLTEKLIREVEAVEAEHMPDLLAQQAVHGQVTVDQD
jgi:hypothetical protein